MLLLIILGNCTISGPSTIACKCSSNYTGNVCQYQNACVSNPCLNGGTCSSVNSQYTCTCNANFTGSNCETNSNRVCFSSSCLNGGTCLVNSLTNLTYCQCASSFTG